MGTRTGFKVSSSSKVPSMNAQGGMFTGSAFEKASTVKARPMPAQRTQFIPSGSGSLQRSMGDRFVPAGALRQGPAMGSGASGGVRLIERYAIGQDATSEVPLTTPPIVQPPTAITPAQGGKVQVSYEEAKNLLETLEVALAPITDAERAVEDHACLREMQSGAFPIVRRLGDRLRIFVAEGKPGDTFQISHGEMTMVQKTLDCAESIGRDVTEKVIMATAGVGAAALLLFLL